MYYEMPVQQGWQCPICGRVYAPWNPTCDYCGKNEKQTDNITTKSSDIESTLGIHLNTDGLHVTATGDAKKGEEVGLSIGKAMMYDYIEKELLYRNLLTDDIKEVLYIAKSSV